MNFPPSKPSGVTRTVRTAALALLLGGAACSGNIEGHGNNGGPSTPTNPGDKTPGDKGNMTGAGGSPGTKPQDPPPPPAMPAPAGSTASVAPLRRLNAHQYKNTVQDLLGLGDLVTDGALPPDESIGDDRFISNVTRLVQSSDVESYANLAEAIARKAVSTPGTLLGCDLAGNNEASCVAGFIERFGKRAFRRPLTPAEIDRAKEVFAAGKTGADAMNGVRLVVQTFLQAPSFLYLVEPSAGSGDKIVAVDGWTMASRLSYFLLNSMPDEDLFKAAGDNQLSNPDQVGQQAQRLMGSQRFREMVANFHSQWLEIDALKSASKNEMLFPAWNEPLRAAMLEEPRRFVEYVMKEGDGKLETLLTAPFSVISGPLYDFYGVTKPAGAAANEWKKVDLDPKQRAGLFTQAGIMASLAGDERTSFIRRGRLVRAGLLCTPVPDPPPGVDATEAMVPAGADARTRAKQHRDKPECASCHALFDPLGFPFESFDAIGKFRATENGKPVDTTSEVTITRSLNGPVKDAVEMLGKMAKDDEVRECLARQWMRFALGRDEVNDDKGSLESAVNGFKSGGWKVSDLLSAIARSDSFRYQKVTP
jgi:hypothetical protein